MTEEQHVDLCTAIRKLSGKVILSGYPSDLYRDQLESQGVDPSFLIANRLTPDFGDNPATTNVPDELLSNLHDLDSERNLEARNLEPLHARRPGTPFARLPVLTGLLDEPADTLSLLGQLGSLLGGGD